MKNITFINKWMKPVCKNNLHEIESDYYSRFGKEYCVIYEHCLSYIHRLITDAKYATYLLNTSSTNLVLLEKNCVSIFLPELKPVEFDKLHRDIISTSRTLLIRDVIKEYLDINCFYITKKYHYSIKTHSSEEVVLSTNKVANLIGYEYAGLRTALHRIERSGSLKYCKLSDMNYSEILRLFQLWYSTQGMKYKTDRSSIDLEYLKYFSSKSVDRRFISRIILYKGCLCGIALIEIVRPGFGIYIMNKCLNGVKVNGNVYGVSGLSKYLYYRTCKELLSYGVQYVNIGSLGTEYGARKCKQDLRPIGKYLEAYQIKYCNA